MQSADKILTSSEKFHISLGLERTLSALEKLNNPQDKMEFIHVAGTNGKGSVCAILNEILCTHFLGSGTKIGLFTSPHLFSYCERIKINGVDISQNDLDKYINLAASANSELTEFEILAVAAFLYFRDCGAKYVILEVGLGGLYDATNVIKNPLCSIITTIDFDHTARLGNTIEKIAKQKAGIAKLGRPLVVSKNNAGYKTIKECAENVGAELISVQDNISIEYKSGKNYAIIEGNSFEFSLLGDFQAKNLALVLEGIKSLPFKISDTTVKKALKNIRWKFRLDYDSKRRLLIDGAHNPSGIKSLRDFLDKNFSNEKKTFIFGCLNNKDYKYMLKTLVKKEDEFYFYEFNYPNVLKFSELPYEVQKFAKNTKNPHKIIDEHEGICVVCGSLYMLGQLFKPQ